MIFCYDENMYYMDHNLYVCVVELLECNFVMCGN